MIEATATATEMQNNFGRYLNMVIAGNEVIITKNGKELDKSKYTWDEKTRTLSTAEDNLVLDFSDYDEVTFKTGSHCTFNTGSGCTFNTGNSCIFNTCSDCTFNTGSGCIFNTYSNCTFKTGYDCIFKTGYDCTFNTGIYCTFETGIYCTFKTGSNCTFKTGYGCTFKTGYGCVAVRREIFEAIKLPQNKEVQLCLYNISGYIKDGYYYKDDEKQYPAIIADGILSEVINHKGNVYRVKNYGEEEITYLIKDGDTYSHGDTLKEAKDSLVYKISNRDTSVYKGYTLETIVTLEQAIKMYRVVTGACEGGTRHFVETHKLPKKMTVKELIEITQGKYGNDKLVEFVKGELDFCTEQGKEQIKEILDE